MSEPATKDLKVVRGDTKRLYFGVKRSGVRVDLEGGTVTSQIRATVDEGTVAGAWTCTLSDQLTDPGGVLITLPKEVSAGLSAASYVYDVQIDFPDGDRRTVIAGKITMIKDVTRDA